MKGKYEIVVKDSRKQYKFTIRRNITILRGDSATGKTTLIDMIAAYQRDKENSGIIIKSEKECVVLTSINWEMNLNAIEDKIVFIDEGEDFVKMKKFSKKAQESSNYYVIATRSSLENLLYSIHEVYGIKNVSGNKYEGTKRIYCEFYSLYKEEEITENPFNVLIVEDSHAGFEFYEHI